jgi:hypothetical protein
MPLSPVEPLGSLSELFELAASERNRQTAHFEALDAKAGLLLVFAGAFIALAPDIPLLLRSVGAMAASGAGIVALWALWPRRFEVLKLDAVREEALDLPAVQTQRLLLDTHVAAWLRNQRRLESKSARLRAAFVLLLTAVLVYAGGILVVAMGAMP